MKQLSCLLAGVDFSPRSLTAAQMAVTLARPAAASVEMMHVVEGRVTEMDAQILGLSKETIEQTEIREATAQLNAVAGQLGYAKITARVVCGNAAASLTQWSREIGADIVLVGDTGAQSRGSRHGLGVTAQRLVHNGPDRLLVVKPCYHGALDRIAAAVDFSPVSDDVMRQAVLVADLVGARLYAVHAFSTMYAKRMRRLVHGDTEMRILALQDTNQKRLGEFVQRFAEHAVPIEPVALAGSASSALLKYVRDERMDLVVVGTGATLRIAGFPIGSTAHAVIGRSLSSVFVIRASEQSNAEAA